MRADTTPPAYAYGARLARGLAAMAGEEERLRIRVSGHCMDPAIRDGDELALGAATLPMPGDVVAVLDPRGRVRVHRLLGYRPRWRRRRPFLALVTRADNGRTIDPPTPRARLIGRVEGIAGRGPLAVDLGDRLAAVGQFLTSSACWLLRRIQNRPARRP